MGFACQREASDS